jgi:hypothetical protein
MFATRSFNAAMAALALVTAIELAWIAVPGGAYFVSSPAAVVSVYTCFVLAIWARWPPAYWIAVVSLWALAFLLTVQLLLFGMGVVAGPWLAMTIIQLALLLSRPVKFAVRGR